MRDQDAEEIRRRAAWRASQVMGSWHAEGTRTIRTAYGDVVLEDVKRHTDPESGVVYLDVAVGGPSGGDPHYRVVNPPTLVPDPSGPVVAHGKRWREDPLAALAEVIGRHGGAQAQRGRHGR